jgi:putative ABC transport system substrate-binding protein
MLLALCDPVQAQPAKIPRIGYISRSGDVNYPGPQVEAFRQGLRDLGYVEGKNILIEYRYIGGRPGSNINFAADLVQDKVDVLVATSRASIEAAKQSTKTIPIVMVLPDDPVERGFVDSLARPGRNITGLSTLSRELSGKRLELLKDTVPELARVGVIWSTANNRTSYRDYEPAARALKLTLRPLGLPVTNPDWPSIFRETAKGRVGALITIATAPLLPQREKILELAIKNRLPAMFEGSDWVDAGGLMSYSSRDVESFKRAAYYVDKILKGTKPADLPVEQPRKFELVINLKTAKQIGLTIPQKVLIRADRVIR